MELQALVATLNGLLDINAVDDYCPNGLQVEGRSQVRRIVAGVSASRALFLQALSDDADLILVHHGLLWNGPEAQRIIGSHRERLRMLLENNVSLVAYHLPLDRHMELGNSAQMARRLGMGDLEPFGLHHGQSVGVCGILPEPVPPRELFAAVTEICDREPHVFPGNRPMISSVGIVTGAAQREYHQAVAAGLDAYITGEASEWVLQQAAEDGVHYLAAGHYATERFGVQALARWLSRNHDLETRFVDIPNPV